MSATPPEVQFGSGSFEVRLDSDRLQQRLLGPIPIGVAGAAAVTALHFHDPHVAGSWGHCPFLALTGLPCPGCGGLRAINDLTNGDLHGAFASNAMAVVLAATLGVLWLTWLVRYRRGGDGSMMSPRTATALAVGFGVAFLLFGAFRMTPWGAWLRP
jgi:hypothetical protein